MPEHRHGADGGRRGGSLILGLVALALALGVPYFEAVRNANERPRLLQGMALVECGEWAIDGPAARRLAPGPDISRSPLDGRLYPNKPPATSLVAAGAYRLGQIGEPATLRSYTAWARILGGWLPTVLLCLWIWRRFAPSLGPAPVAASLTIYALGTPAASYAHLLYGHQLAAALLTVGAVLIVDAVTGGRRWWAALGGTLAALSVTVEYGAAFAGLPIAIFLAVMLRRRGRAVSPVIAAAVAASLAPVILLGTYHAAVYGSAWATGYHHVINPDFAAKHGQGFLGLGLPTLAGLREHIFAADTGLLWWAPTALVGLVGLVALSRRGEEARTRGQAGVLAGILGLFLLLTISLSFTGGWRVGPRYIVVALPAMVPGLAWALSWARRRPLALTGIVALTTWSVIVNGLAANLWPHIDPTNVDYPLGEILVPLARKVAPYDLLSASGGGDLPVLALVGGASALAIVGALLGLARGARRAYGALVLGVGIGLLVVALSLRLPAHPRSAANLRYIERVWEPREGASGPSVVLGPLGEVPGLCGGPVR